MPGVLAVHRPKKFFGFLTLPNGSSASYLFATDGLGLSGRKLSSHCLTGIYFSVTRAFLLAQGA